jgi:putative nucleotidyltransferase with HDIG domain
MTCQELFRQLDDAIYKAKSAGRNYVYAFSAAETATKAVDYARQSPGMKAEVTRKFIDRFFRGTEQGLSQLHEPTIRAFLKALEIWDPGTVQHCLRVNRIAMAIARAMDLPKADSLILNLGTLLHDIGKLTIGDTILAKPGPLTEAEYALMKNHPQIGFDLIKDDPALRKAADIIVMHHERFDGTGYPLQISGKQIPLLARICAVADAMDAMLTDRPYSKGRTVEEVRREISHNKGRQFDPEIVDVVLAVDWNIFHQLSAIPWGQVALDPEQA